MSRTKDKRGPIEVRLTQPRFTVTCQVVCEDESTQTLDVESLSLRGAERETTGWFISQGYQPAGRWKAVEGSTTEVTRRFKPAKDKS
jgi:hypothetical protein